METQKANVGIKISFLEIPCMPIFRQTYIFFFGLNLPKNYFWGRNFKNVDPDLESALS